MTDQQTPDFWEYTYVEGSTVQLDEVTRIINDMGADGWELISTHSADRVLGLNSTTLFLRRRIVPLPPPEDPADGWYPDPAGRFQARYWNGWAWTLHVTTGTEEKRDPPTRLPTGVVNKQ